MKIKYDYWDPILEITNLYETYKLIEYIVYKNDILFNNKIIVDLGCGWGRNSNLIAAGVAKEGFLQVPQKVIGLDYDSSEIEMALKTSKHFNNLDFKYHDISKPLPFDANTIDIFFSTYALHNLKDEIKQTVFNQIVKTLRPGGYFIYIDVLFEKKSELLAISSVKSLKKLWQKEAFSLDEKQMQILLDVHLDPKHPFSLILTGIKEFPISIAQANLIGEKAGLKLIDAIKVNGLVCCRRMIFVKEKE